MLIFLNFTRRSFIHRCGRTARMGRSGDALVFLLPSETAYIQYMNISQNVLLTLLSDNDVFTIEESQTTVDRVMEMLCKER